MSLSSNQPQDPYTLKWGILACGWISKMFTTDLLSDPKTRKVNDVNHKVVAVASRDIQKVQPFLEECLKDAGLETTTDIFKDVKHYGSYDELVNDPNVDCIYIGTPHSHHFQNAYACLQAGKHVLCEKPITINAKQIEILVKLAREKNLFFMEALWTRFQPFAYKLQEIISSNVIGPIQIVQSECNSNFAPMAKENPSHRLVNPDLGGGALLDVGGYSWTQLALTLLPLGPAIVEGNELDVIDVKSSMIKLPSTGVDATVVASIKFNVYDDQQEKAAKRQVMGTMMTSQVSQTAPSRCTMIQGTKGFIEVFGRAYCPKSLTYSSWESEKTYREDPKPHRTESFDFESTPGRIKNYVYQADEVARCIRDGKSESERMPLKETVLMMKLFDEIRRQGDFKYPNDLESTEFRGQ